MQYHKLSSMTAKWMFQSTHKWWMSKLFKNDHVWQIRFTSQTRETSIQAETKIKADWLIIRTLPKSKTYQRSSCILLQSVKNCCDHQPPVNSWFSHFSQGNLSFLKQTHRRRVERAQHLCKDAATSVQGSNPGHELPFMQPPLKREQHAVDIIGRADGKRTTTLKNPSG